jgi:hypothetical protein
MVRGMARAQKEHDDRRRKEMYQFMDSLGRDVDILAKVQHFRSVRQKWWNADQMDGDYLSKYHTMKLLRDQTFAEILDLYPIATPKVTDNEGSNDHRQDPPALH